jgi:hypothetical protein
MRELYRRKHSEDTRDLIDILQEPGLTENALASPERIDDLLPRKPSNRLHKVNNRALIIDNEDGTYHTIARDKAAADEVSAWTISEIERVGRVTTDFGLTLDNVITGKDFGLRVLRQVENQGIIQREAKNEFEKQVSADLTQVTNSVLSNQEIMFAKPDESFEYDVLLPIANQFIVDIEVKDHEIVREETHLNFDNMKQRIISVPLDKAKRISAVAIVVTKGFPRDKLNQLKELGTSRSVVLLDESGYKTEIERFILRVLLRRAGIPRRILTSRPAQ